MRTPGDEQRRLQLEEIDQKERQMFRLLTELGMPIEEQLRTVSNSFRHQTVLLFRQSISTQPHVQS